MAQKKSKVHKRGKQLKVKKKKKKSFWSPKTEKSCELKKKNFTKMRKQLMFHTELHCTLQWRLMPKTYSGNTYIHKVRLKIQRNRNNVLFLDRGRGASVSDFGNFCCKVIIGERHQKCRLGF